MVISFTKFILVIVCVAGLFSITSAQRNTENWVFGAVNYVTFREGRAQLMKPLPPGIARLPTIGVGGVVSMSDRNGRLQFFGDKYDIYNRSGGYIISSIISDIYFINAQSNAVMALPKPGNPDLYYYFYMGRDNDVTRQNRKLAYLTIDMNLNNGLGGVLPGKVAHNNFLDAYDKDVAFKITATQHCNKRDYWIISHYLNTNEYCAYLVTADGVKYEPVISNGLYTPVIGTNKMNEHGMMKVSPAGNRVAAAWCGEAQLVEVADFDASTGRLSNFRLVKPDVAGVELPYGLGGDNLLHGINGIDFSPSGQLMYVSGHTDVNPPLGDPQHNSGNYYRLSYLLQYSQLAASASLIKSTERIIDTIYHSSFGGMQTGPDGKIYINNGIYQRLLALENPESPTIGSAINRKALGNDMLEYNFGNLPAFVQSLVRYPIVAEGNCQQQLIKFSLKNTFQVDSIQWDFGDTNSKDQNTATSMTPSHLFSAPGWFNVKAIVYANKECLPDTIGIGVYAGKFEVAINGKRNICGNDSIKLSSSINGPGYLSWSTGDTTSSIIVRSSGRYSLRVNEGQCVAYDSVEVVKHLPPLFNLGKDTAICEAETIEIGVPKGDAQSSYVWNTGETTPSIVVSKAGSYILSVVGQGACVFKDTIKINEKPLPRFTLGNDTSFCLPGSIKLSVLNTNDSVVWNFGIRNNSINIEKPGVYICTAFLKGCKFSDSIIVQAKEAPVFSLGADTTICDGAMLRLNKPIGQLDTFIWNTGATTALIDIEKEGRYWLNVSSNGCKWSDSINVQTNSTPKLVVSDAISVCDTRPIELAPDLIAGKDVRWQWSTGSNSPSITINQPDSYYVTASNYCGSDKKQILIKAGDCKVSFPNAFSPNSDGINDLYYAKGTDRIEKFSFTIFDRYGNVIYTTNNPSFKWDGRGRANDLPAGVYYWRCEYTRRNYSSAASLSGSLTLLR